MTRREFISCASGAAVAASPIAARSERALKHVVYFTHSAGYRHQVIPLSQQIVQQLGTNSGTFDVTSTEDISVFTSENLARYAAVIFYTSGELPMSPAQKAALLEFVRLGGGFLGSIPPPTHSTLGRIILIWSAAISMIILGIRR